MPSQRFIHLSEWGGWRTLGAAFWRNRAEYAKLRASGAFLQCENVRVDDKQELRRQCFREVAVIIMSEKCSYM